MARISGAASYVALEPETGVQLYSVRRLDLDGDMASLHRAANRLQGVAMPASASSAVRPGYDAFRMDITGVGPIHDGRDDALRPPRYTAVEPSGPEAQSDPLAQAGPSYDDPPPPYALPGQLPEVLPPSPPPAYSAEDAWLSHFVGPSAPPPDEERSAISRYLDAGYPRSDV
ncbi:hypothetical protein PAN31117_03471 [Pandoraea anapnoica]|uniref:Uncharacterized protein n=1 Tax=Pandoraea anapnoica TaxID=2508301 RepID=A0A5E5AAB4_9BURK|nr:hypothetical protein [Pandoraea anapnoica]VVE69812.1 hypothetical protein PAN31117_03471 [Pandoraea anapnoica]